MSKESDAKDKEFRRDSYWNKERLEAHQAPKTLAWYDPTNQHVSTNKDDPLFTPLGQLWPLAVKREWEGLTDAEINGLSWMRDMSLEEEVELIRGVEAKLKEKNGG